MKTLVLILTVMLFTPGVADASGSDPLLTEKQLMEQTTPDSVEEIDIEAMIKAAKKADFSGAAPWIDEVIRTYIPLSYPKEDILYLLREAEFKVSPVSKKYFDSEKFEESYLARQEFWLFPRAIFPYELRMNLRFNKNKLAGLTAQWIYRGL